MNLTINQIITLLGIHRGITLEEPIGTREGDLLRLRKDGFIDEAPGGYEGTRKGADLVHEIRRAANDSPASPSDACGPEVWSLVVEDLTGLGGPMGTETTQRGKPHYFSSSSKAKDAALDFYREATRGGLVERQIDWKKVDGGWTSGDLSFVMYHIKKVEVED